MVANPLPENDDKGLTVVQPASTVEVAKNAFYFLWDALHTAEGKELVEGAGFALSDINTAFNQIMTQNERQQETIVALEAAARTLLDQRDQAILEAKNTYRQATRVVTEEISHKIAYEMISDFSPEVAETLLEILTGEETGYVSRFTLNKMKEAMEEAAGEIAELYEGCEDDDE